MGIGSEVGAESATRVELQDAIDMVAYMEYGDVLDKNLKQILIQRKKVAFAIKESRPGENHEMLCEIFNHYNRDIKRLLGIVD